MNENFDHLKVIVKNFLDYIEKNGTSSYDPYDFWGTRFGIFAREIYYKNKLLSIPLIFPILLLDIYFPQIRKVIINKKKYSIADAHILMGYLNLYLLTSKEEYLSKAIDISDYLLKTSIEGFSGYCWGYPFDWQSNNGFWKKNTPFATVTPYCFEAFLMLYDITGLNKYLDISFSISKFIDKDINYKSNINQTLSASYSPFDNTSVINSSAYCAYILIESYKRFGVVEYKSKAEKLISFVLYTQQDDGSWFYSFQNPKDIFIDNIHTCFVLKNLIKYNNLIKNNKVEIAILKGFNYYINNLLNKDGLPKPFTKTNKFNLIKTDLYDYAEAINLFILMKNFHPSAITLLEKLIKKVIDSFATKNGTFVSKVNNLGLKIKLPYLRWGQSQMFYALTKFMIEKNIEFR